MAVPYPTLQSPLNQRPAQLMQPDLLSAFDGLDPRIAAALSTRDGMAGISPGMLLPSDLSALGRMTSDGGVLPHSNLPYHTTASYLRQSNSTAGSRGLAGRRTLVEVNHNKAITKKLVSATHYQQVLDCVSQHVLMFDEVNVATALHRLAKLQPPGPSGHSSPIVFADQFQQLVAAVSRLLPRFEAQAVSNTMWAFATLSYLPEGGLLDDIATHAVNIIGTFRPQATSNTLWAFAKLGYCPSRALLEAGAGQMLLDLSKSVPQDISNTLWAFAALKHHPGAELMTRAATQAILTIQRFKPQELANTLWSFATLEHEPPVQLLDTMAFQIVTKIQGFRPQAVSNTLWAYAKLRYNPGVLLLDVASQKAAGMLHQYTSQELANTVWALGALEHHPGTAILDSAATQISRRMQQFSPEDTANSIWGFSQLLFQPSKELTQGFAFYTLCHWSQMRATDIVKILGALALVGGCPAASWQLLLSNLSSLPVKGFSDADLREVYQMYLLLKPRGPAFTALFSERGFSKQLLEESETAWRASVRKKTWVSPLHQEVSRMLWQIGVDHSDNCTTPDGLHTASILLTDTNIAIEVDDLSQVGSNPLSSLGRSAAKRAMLEGSGYAMVEVSHMDWANCGSVLQQQTLLASLLAACSSNAMPSPGSAQPHPSAPLPVPSQASSAQMSHLPPSPFSHGSHSPASSAFNMMTPSVNLPSVPSSSSAFNLESLSRSLQ